MYLKKYEKPLCIKMVFNLNEILIKVSTNGFLEKDNF